MPGVTACGRCGSPLALNDLDIDVHPPRASAGAKTLRRWNPFSPLFYQARDAGDRVRKGWFRTDLPADLPGGSLGVLARMLVPGWVNFHLGQRVRGWAFLCAYPVLLLLSFLLYGTMAGALFLGLAFSVHLSSCLAVLILPRMDLPRIIGTVAVTAAVLFFGIYMPAGWLAGQAVSPAVIPGNASPLAEGDVLLYSPVLYRMRSPRVGEIVIYHRTGGTISLPGPQEQNMNFYIAPGQSVDRILAGPRDQVEFKDGQLLVNGLPAPWRPLAPLAKARNMSFPIPEGHYFIPPATGQAMREDLPPAIWRQVSIVPAGSVQGRVWMRSYPWSRFGRIS
jgi:hypothetical protein